MSTPNSIRNVSWAVVRAGTERRHAYRKAVDIHLNGSKIGDITPAGARPTGPGENVIDGTDILTIPRRRHKRVRRETIGYLFQD